MPFYPHWVRLAASRVSACGDLLLVSLKVDYVLNRPLGLYRGPPNEIDVKSKALKQRVVIKPALDCEWFQ